MKYTMVLFPEIHYIVRENTWTIKNCLKGHGPFILSFVIICDTYQFQRFHISKMISFKYEVMLYQ